MKDILVGLSLLWLLPFSVLTADYIIKDEQEKKQIKKELKKCSKLSKRS